MESPADVDIQTPYGHARRLDDGRYQVSWRLGGIEADFTMEEEAPGWIPRGTDGVNESPMEFYWAVHQGRSRITGTLSRNGAKTAVHGVGYADHNWGTRPLSEITHRWLWGRIIADDFTIIYADVDYRDPSIESRPLYVAKGDGMIVGTGSPTIHQFDFTTHPERKRHYPKKLRIEYRDAHTHVDINIRHQELVESFDLLQAADLSPVTRCLVRTFIARPSYFRVLAVYSGKVTVDGEQKDIGGECLYEVMEFD